MNKFLHRFLLLMLAAVWCMAAALPGTVAEAADQVPCWRLDAPAGNGLPRNIFSTYGWRSLPDEINKTGLEDLHISGSMPWGAVIFYHLPKDMESIVSGRKRDAICCSVSMIMSRPITRIILLFPGGSGFVPDKA